jgi:hypothetical protein
MTARLVDNPPELHAATEQHDADFHEGFEAGYRAYASQRAVLGTPAYRQGHAYGVQQAAAERRDRAALDDRPTPRARLVRGLVFGIIFGLILGWALVRSARADTLSDWQQLNEVCQGGTGALSDKACAQRSRTTAQLRREGWFEGAHGVWVSPEHVATFTRIVRSYDAEARERTGMLDALMRGMMEDLRRALPPEAIFALWNGRAGQLLATTPYAASGLMFGLPYLERTLSGKRDPRFVMVLRP